MERQVTIATFDDLGVACIARGRLESAGVPCFLLNEHLVAMNPLYANLVHGIGLVVFERDEAVARELLTGGLSRADLAEEDKALGPDIETALFEPDLACPRCGSTDIKEFSLRRPLLAVSFLLFGMPLKFGASAYTCRICGRKWRDGKETGSRDDGQGPVI